MRKRFSPIPGVLTLIVLVALAASIPAATGPADDVRNDAGLVVHEWGTFTTVAGADGKAVEWLPLAGPADLPCFVYHFESPTPRYEGVAARGLNYNQARAVLKGMVRMETPVLYFYSPKQVDLSVKVKFPQGLMTEWYPKATVTQADVFPETLSRVDLQFLTPSSRGTQAQITWANVRVMKGPDHTLPETEGESHYYLARNTDAAQVNASGQYEKFLFYRGVGQFGVPLSVQVGKAPNPAGRGDISILNSGPEPISTVILFENRGGRIGYKVQNNVEKSVAINPADLAGSIDTLKRDMEAMLIARGLYPKEAHAMVDTWKDSWFEEGTRVFYVVPQKLVDGMLPLEIAPQKPNRIVRVFVGRMEVIDTAVPVVREALAKNDAATLALYSRFLGSIADRLPKSDKLNALIDKAYKSYISSVTTCK